MSLSLMKIRRYLTQDDFRQKRIVFGIVAGLIYIAVMLAGLWLARDLVVLALAVIGIGIPLLVLLWYYPVYGLLAIIFLTSSFVKADVIDIRLPIGGGFDLRDLTLLGVGGIIFIRELSNKTLVVPWWRVGGPLLAFLLLAIISAFYAILYQNVETNWALGDLRILFYYVVFFLVIWSIKQDKQFRILVIGLFLLADLTTLIIVIQQFLGASNPVLKAMMSATGWGIYQVTGGVRVVPAGHILMHFMWFVAFGLFIFGSLSQRQKYFLIFQLVFMGFGHILTYVRAQWVAIFIGLILFIPAIVKKYKIALPRYVMIGVSIVFIISLIFGIIGFSDLYQIPIVSGVIDRFASLLALDNTMETDSLQWRVFENNKAIESILKHPFLGVGLGGRYRELTTLQGEAEGLWTRGSLAAGEVSRFTRYVHNSYLSITVKMGIPSILVYLWFCLAFLWCGWRTFRNLRDLEYKGIALGIIAGFVGMLAWSYYHAHFIKVEATPVVGLMAGLVAVMGVLDIHDTYPQKQSASVKSISIQR